MDAVSKRNCGCAGWRSKRESGWSGAGPLQTVVVCSDGNAPLTTGFFANADRLPCKCACQAAGVRVKGRVPRPGATGGRSQRASRVSRRLYAVGFAGHWLRRSCWCCSRLARAKSPLCVCDASASGGRQPLRINLAKPSKESDAPAKEIG